MFKAMDRVVLLEASGSNYAGLFGFVDNVYEEDGQMIDARVWLERTDGSTFPYYVDPHGAMLVEDGTPELLAESAASEQRMLDYKRARREGDSEIERARQLLQRGITRPVYHGSATMGYDSTPSTPPRAEPSAALDMVNYVVQAQAADRAAMQAESDTYWHVNPYVENSGSVQEW